MSSFQTLKDYAVEQRTIQIRIIMALACVVALLGIIVFRFYHLQITQYDIFQTESEENRIRLQRIAPNRGLILDREQRIIAENRPSFVLALVRDKISDMPKTLDELERLDLASREEIEKFTRFANRYRIFEPVPLRFNLNDEEIARFAENRFRLEGVEMQANLARYYPEKEMLVHMVGYVGRINERELATLDKDNYGATNHIGKIGVERNYESILHGTVGYEYVETDAHGQVYRTLDRKDPVSGKNLELHIDLDLQRVAYEALGEKNRGAVVAINTRNGGIIAAVSRPGYDPNPFVNGIRFDDYKALNTSIDVPLLNRVLQAQYPPGSTIKPFIGLAGLDEQTVNEKTVVFDPGWFRLPGNEHQYRDWKREGHGSRIDFLTAMEQSCDVYFYTLANRMGVKAISRFLGNLGFGQKTGIDVPEERKGINPSPEWKKGRGWGNWYAGDTLSIGIGQGYIVVTPLQLAYATSIVANKGERYVPHMVARIGGKELPAEKLEKLVLRDEKNWDILTRSMQAVVHGPRGTAKGISRDLQYTIAGKTGTAQVVAIKQGEKYDARLVAERHRDHALFIAFAPVEAPEIAVAVIVENGEHGSTSAAPVARKVMDAWMKKIGIVKEPAGEEPHESP
jgi:penicillin-binding protein 2